jgi:hypothetical protein
VKHVATSFRGGVEYNTFTKDWLHKGVCLSLVEHLLWSTKEELIGFGSTQKNNLTLGKVEYPYVAALVPHALKEADRVGTELLKMTTFTVRA